MKNAKDNKETNDFKQKPLTFTEFKQRTGGSWSQYKIHLRDCGALSPNLLTKI